MTKESNFDASNANLSLEKMRYNNNKLSYYLGLGGIALSLLSCFIGLNSLQPTAAWSIFLILLNILILLFGFLTAEKVKVYSKNFSYYSIGLGAVCIARIFMYPLLLIRYYNKFMDMINSATKFELNDVHSNAVTKYGDVLGATIVGKASIAGVEDGKNVYEIVKTGYLTSNGNIRGTLMIIFLCGAAACFISAGVINYFKEKKLSTYLTSIGQKR